MEFAITLLYNHVSIWTGMGKFVPKGWVIIYIIVKQNMDIR